MTTLDPGASDVFTQGFVASPRSTAFLASSPAATITCGLDVLVQLVMAAMATCPWSSSKDCPSAAVTGTRREGRSVLRTATGSGWAGSGSRWLRAESDGGSLAGNDSAPAS